MVLSNRELRLIIIEILNHLHLFTDEYQHSYNLRVDGQSLNIKAHRGLCFITVTPDESLTRFVFISIFSLKTSLLSIKFPNTLFHFYCFHFKEQVGITKVDVSANRELLSVASPGFLVWFYTISYHKK